MTGQRDGDVRGVVSSACPHSAEEGVLVSPIQMVESADRGFSEKKFRRRVYNVRKRAMIKEMKLSSSAVDVGRTGIPLQNSWNVSPWIR
jgi:hypothetical protein